MLLFRSRKVLVALLQLIAGNTCLSAFDIPVELPSGQTIHFDTEEGLSVDPDSYTISIRVPIEDPEEFRIFSENSEILNLLSQSIQEKWKLHDVKFHFEERIPLITFTITPTDMSILLAGSGLKIEPISLYTPPENGQLVSCGGSTFTISTVGTLIIDGKSTLSDLSWDLTFLDNGAEIKNASPEDDRIDAIPEELHDSKTTENTAALPNEENIQEKSKHYLHFFFSIPGNDFGGGWRLTPYELRFIRRQDNALDDLILLINSDRSVLYKRKCDHPIFTPSESTPKALRDNLNGTYTLIVPSEGEFLFNSNGQLIQFIDINKNVTTYDYSGNKLASIFYPNARPVSFEYSGDRIVNINGLSNMVYLEYDEKNFLCKIFDNQSSANFSYEDNEFDKITDEAGTIVDFRHPILDESQIEEKVPLIFNGNGEVFYYRNAQNMWKFSYRWLDSDENAEEESE